MKSIISLIAVAFVLFIFTFYMDGEMGVIIIAFMLFAPLVSLVFALYGRKRIKVSFDCDAYVKKGSELEVKISVEKEGVFPLPIVEIVPASSHVFSQKETVYRLSLARDNKIEFSYKIPAEIGGNGEIYIGSVYSCGFLGFIKFKSKCMLPEPKIVGVIPDIPEITPASGLFRAVADSVITSDEEEENNTSMLFSANTSPGYEHREYVPGDPLKRVNWKLSSKNSKLMVRLDEAVAAVQPCLILDMYRNSDAEIYGALRREEKLLQSAFGLLELLIKQGIASTFIYRGSDGNIVSESIDNPDYPAQLLLEVLSVKIVPDKRLDVGSGIGNVCACIAATTQISDSFSEIIRKFPDKENSCVIVPYANASQDVQIPVWYLADDNTFKLI